MNHTWTRLGAWALVLGCVVGALGYLAAGVLVPGDLSARLQSPLWIPLNSVALAGDLLVLLGLPVALGALFGRFRVLTVLGTVGTWGALAMLNLGEGVIETYVKPYLVRHGGVPTAAPAGWDWWENVALLLMLVGLVCLGLTVILGRRVPWVAGALLIASPLAAFLGLPGALALLSDYLAFAGLAIVGIAVIRHPAADLVRGRQGSASAPAEQVPA
jgi:hypothetical protein